MESLFSLEVIVNYIKILHEKVACLFPCIAFRLLDYPTIAIHLLDEIDSKELKLKLEMSQQNKERTHFKDLLDKHGRYIFAKGKSCLFRAELDTLRGHLRNAPLYVLLLDTYQEPYKLLGTCAVPLTSVMEEMYKELNETNLDIPCTKITHGVFEVKNLMGDEIGHISFACRLSSFGSTLLPHIGVTHEAIERQNKLKSVNETNNKKAINGLINVEKNLTSTVVQTVPIDYKNAQIQITNADIIPSTLPISTQEILSKTSGTQQQQQQIYEQKQKFNEKIQLEVNDNQLKIKKTKIVEDEFVFNHYCPPPLHYNKGDENNKNFTKSEITNKLQENIKKINETKEAKSKYEAKRIEFLQKAIINQLGVNESQMFDNEQEFIEQYEQEVVALNKKNSIESSNINNIKSNNQNTKFDFNDFPILKCLIDEISKLKSLSEGTNTTQLSKKIQPIEQRRSISSASVIKQKPKDKNLVGILKSQNRYQHQQQQKLSKETLLESVNRLSRPRTAEINRNNKQQPILKEQNLDEHVEHKKKPKLKYGTTNTYRMRVLASRPQQVDKINDEHLELIKKLKSNLDELTDSSQTNTPRVSLQKQKDFNAKLQQQLANQQQILQQNTEYPQQLINHLSISNSTYNSSKSPLNLSLLNKVEMESTIDYAMSRNLVNFNMNSQENVMLKNSLQQSSNQANSSSGGQNTKFVQFGNTYVLNHPSDDSTTTPVTATRTNTSTTTTTNSPANQVIKSRTQTSPKPIVTQLQRRSSQTSSISSSKSRQTSNDFEDDDVDDASSIKMSQLNLNSDDMEQIVGSSLKIQGSYSSSDFCTDTKSREDKNETIFSIVDTKSSY